MRFKDCQLHRSERFVGVFGLALLLSIPSAAQNTTQIANPSPEKQRAAGETADRLMRRFYETLNFADVYRDMYVSNPALREFEIETIVGNMVKHFPDTVRKEPEFSIEAME